MAARAGHDINYAALTGALHAIGPKDSPIPPLNLVADFGGGSMFLVAGVLAALVERTTSRRGQVIDVAMVDGTSSLLTMIFGMMSGDAWRDERYANSIDGGAPYYTTYACRDGRHVAVGALEPRFYTELVAGLGLTEEVPINREDPSTWPQQRMLFAGRFATRARDEWAELFGATDACVTPVLSLEEAARDPHLSARGTYVSYDGVRQPAPAPRFSRTPAGWHCGPSRSATDIPRALRAWGMSAGESSPAAGQHGHPDASETAES
jgi:alpha-methylacyl-CoA racemase